MRPELEDTLAASGAAAATPPPTAAAQAGLADTAALPALDPAHTATAPRAPATTAGPGLVGGQQLGHFRIERPLGAGGMGEVYLATDLALERAVALKVLPGDLARDPTRRDRLVREARAQARVHHPNVGHIYFIGEEAGRLYFAMEYVPGDTVAARLAAGPLPANDALAIVRAAALGLREAQRAGITHRDIKPSNLMIDNHGMVKVLDFGLAATGPAACDASDPGDGRVAQTHLAGTPLYMAPEQGRGEPIDFRADIYALGATLFHLVAGRPPFEADDLGTLLSKHASSDRPSLPRRSGQPRTAIAAIDALCGKMMAPAPRDRFASYDELIRAIELASADHMQPAGAVVRLLAAGLDLLLAAALAAAIVLPLAALLDWRTNNLNLSLWIAYATMRAALIARSGRSLGQWLFELEVIDVTTGKRPSLRRAALRVGVPIIGPVIAALLEAVLALGGARLEGVAQIALFAVGAAAPLALIWASLRSVSKQAVWDKLSHTMVRYRARRTTTI